MDYVVINGELYHYGVVGMKWGVRRARRKALANEKLRLKALKYDKKAASLTKKSEKIHAERDLESSNRRAVKVAKYDKKAAVLAKRALKTDDDRKQLRLEKKSENLKYKAAKARIEGNSTAKTQGYSMKAMKYSVKSDKVAAKAAKARKRIANNKAYIGMMERRTSSLTKEELAGSYSFVNEMLGDK